MYKILDYIYNGLLYINNLVRPHHKRLSQLMLYCTTACQSRCKHCSIWQKPLEHLSLEDIKHLMKSHCITSHTTVGLEGGEFLLHPEANEIMKWFYTYHKNYTLLTNALMPKRVVEAVRTYHPKHLYISLDGNEQTYFNMRGVKGHDKVIQVIETLKDEIPISLMFCLSPYNSFEDMKYVIDIAKHYKIDVRIGIYGTMDFFDTKAGLLESNQQNYLNQIPQNIHDTQENFDFVALYDEWKNGRLFLRCQSIFSCLVIHSNGDVPICQNLSLTLGNIHKQSLDEIFNGNSAQKVQCEYSKKCNECWINFHRKYDIILLRSFERILPKKCIEWLYGKYYWCEDHNITYRKYLQQYDKKFNK